MTPKLYFAAAAILLGVCLLVNELDSHPNRDLIGTPAACTGNFLFRLTRAEILEYGLQDVRGLACDAAGENVFIAEGKRALLLYSTKSNSIVRSRPVVCPGAPCEVTDRRGVAFVSPSLYVAEHGRAQVLVRTFGHSGMKLYSDGSADALFGAGKALPGTPDLISAPAGIAAAEQTLFITDDLSGNSSVLWACSSADCRPTRIAERLQHPSGVAAAGKDGPVYVAELTPQRVDWPIFRNTPDRGWIRTGALGSAPLTGNSPSPFLGLALDNARNLIFAAGPGGLYIFSKDGRNSGRILFDDPVTGIASCGKDVYFAAGHMLCRLKIP